MLIWLFVDLVVKHNGEMVKAEGRKIKNFADKKVKAENRKQITYQH